jgi:hypothetical protein
MKTFIAGLCVGVLSISAVAFAEPVASVVAVRGTSTIERAGKKLGALPRVEIELKDTVTTAVGGKVKLLFIDDSVLTLAEKSRMSIDAFIHSRTDRGNSLFNLLDGKMRAVVGKTKFEVKTPTVVAAARGTVIFFEVGILNGKPFTRITCLEGIVDVRSLTFGDGSTSVKLSAGESMLVTAGQPMPLPTELTPAELETLKRETSTSGAEINLPDFEPSEAIMGNIGITPIPVAPPFDRQEPTNRPQPSRVDIGVKF